MTAMRLRSGPNLALEAAADELIRDSLKGVTSREAKSDILTPWKLKDRQTREILTKVGVVDPSLRRGMYHRRWNSESPHLNSRDGHTTPPRIIADTDYYWAHEE